MGGEHSASICFFWDGEVLTLSLKNYPADSFAAGVVRCVVNAKLLVSLTLTLLTLSSRLVQSEPFDSAHRQFAKDLEVRKLGWFGDSYGNVERNRRK